MSVFKSRSLILGDFGEMCKPNIVLALLLVFSSLLLGACESPEERVAGYIADAEQRLDEGDIVKAEIDVKNALQIQPKNAQARFLMAQINETRREFQDMATNLRAAVEIDPEFAAARIKLGSLYAMAGALELAEEQAGMLTDADRERVDAKILLAQIAAANGDLELASQKLEEALALDSSNMQALGLLVSISASTNLTDALALLDQGIVDAEDDRPLRLLRIQILQRAGNYEDEVIAEYQGLMSDYPDEVAFGYRLAQFLAESGRVNDVEPVLRQIITNDPGNVEARLALTQYAANTQGPEEAEALLLQFVEELPDSHTLRLSLARLYQQTGRSEQAYEEYERVASSARNEDAGLTAMVRMAGINLANGDTEAGQELLEQVLSVDSLNTDALLLRGALYIDQKEYKSAVSDLRSLLRTEPDNLQAQLLIAKAHSDAGDILLAEDAYKRVLNIDPGNVTATLELTRMLVARKKSDGALDLLREQTAAYPDEVRFSRALIGLYLSEKNAAAAEKEAARVAERPGKEAVGEFLLGGVYQARGEDELAISAFEKSLQLSPTAREPLKGMIASMVKLDRADEAIAYLKKLQQENPDNLYAQTLLGQVLAGTGNPDEAQKIFESTLAANESWLPAYTALAGLQSGDISSQIDTYKRGLEAVPASQELVLLLGTAYERSGQIEEAIGSYERALTVNPESPAVANNLAALLADYRTDTKSLERALELASQFSDSDNPAFLDTLGWVHYRLGNYSEAVPLMKKAVDAAGQVAVLRYHLGMGYIAVDKPTLAKEQLELALADENAEFVGVDEARAAIAEL
jgi:tetratricopeptide (TPR) repeat protein